MVQLGTMSHTDEIEDAPNTHTTASTKSSVRVQFHPIGCTQPISIIGLSDSTAMSERPDHW
jgi:hypothetical protein